MRQDGRFMQSPAGAALLRIIATIVVDVFFSTHGLDVLLERRPARLLPTIPRVGQVKDLDIHRRGVQAQVRVRAWTLGVVRRPSSAYIANLF